MVAGVMAGPAVLPGAYLPNKRDASLARLMDPAIYAYDGGFICDPWQASFLRNSKQYRMLNNSRQSGKSSVTAWGVVHKAAFWPNSLVLLVSPGERQSLELMLKVQEAVKTAPFVPKVTNTGSLQLAFANGSRILALPGKEGTIRGFSKVSVLVIDEAARVPNDLYVAVRPMLAVSKGSLWSLSTPYGTRGWWYEEYKRIKEGIEKRQRSSWAYYEVPATMCPRITHEFLIEEEMRLGMWYFGQEYFCKFFDAETAAFTEAEVKRAFEEPVVPWDLWVPGDTVRGGPEQWQL